MFKKATKKEAKLRMMLHGPSGAGKTYSALAIAEGLSQGAPIALVDTEAGSASKYSDRFDFDVLEVTGDYHPRQISEAIKAASEGGYVVLVIDSLTHFWNGPGGVLDLVDAEVAKRVAKKWKADSFAAWKQGTKIYQAHMVDSIIKAPLHVITTARAKQAYEKTEDEKGRTKIQKMGLAPEMRDSYQYEFDVEGILDIDHNLVIGKTRCAALDGRVFTKPGEDIAVILRKWLEGDEQAKAASAEVETLTAAITLAESVDALKALGQELREKSARFAIWQVTSLRDAYAARKHTLELAARAEGRARLEAAEEAAQHFAAKDDERIEAELVQAEPRLGDELPEDALEGVAE